MDPTDPARRDDTEERALRWGEAAVWLLAGVSTAAHVYSVVKIRSIFGGVDTLAALLVAVLLLVLVRGLRRKSREG